jgi:hypothetical protein
MQLVALGEGRFQAMCYGGGLPGSGWNYGATQQLSGQRDGSSTVKLVADNTTVVINHSGAWVFDQQGRHIGRLAKVERTSPTLGLRPPSDARVLFAGSETPELQGAKLTDDGLLLAGVTTTASVSDFRMHIEFRLPYMPRARGQGRANSGVYIQRRYEVQILDSFGLEGAFNECGSLYRQRAPGLNMCYPPLQWQTYDIYFRAARWSEQGQTKTENAVISVFHNGVAVHYHQPISDKTGAGRPESPQPLPIYLQDHGNPVVFRNAWLVEGDPWKERHACCGRW